MRLAGGLADEKFILWRATRVRPRIDDELPVLSQDAFPASDRVFDQRGAGEIFPELNDLKFFRNRKNWSASS